MVEANRGEGLARPIPQFRSVEMGAGNKTRVATVFCGNRRSRRQGSSGKAYPLTSPILRVARPTDNIDRLLPFYHDGLGLHVLYRFQGHDGFDGVMLGRAGAPYHFEFTRKHGHSAGRAPTEDNLLVFYHSDSAAWSAAVQRMREAGFAPVASFNPFWDRDGVTFEDPDGYRIVLQNAAWNR
jgi:catechol 2,3-dioxygenase-like lactoylglutathione lyase family enzyme